MASPPAPFDQRINSPSKRYYALLSAREERTVVYDAATQTRLWEMRGWFRVAALADDGEHFITGYDGGNLIPAATTQGSRTDCTASIRWTAVRFCSTPGRVTWSNANRRMAKMKLGSRG